MDPNANLEQQLNCARAIRRLDDSIADPSTLQPHELRRYDEQRADIEEQICDEALGLAELVLALDEWRRSGGFDPYGPTDPRLADINKVMAVIDTDDRDDTKRELAFAILAVDENDPATLNWLAACCAKRAGDLAGYEPG